MKPPIFGFLAPLTWMCFWCNLWWNQHSYWFWISVAVGYAAVMCTLPLYGNLVSVKGPDDRAGWGLTEGSPAWMSWVVGMCWTLVLFEIVLHLPAYWSKLFPLLVVIALGGASLVWTAVKSEAKLEEPPS